MKTQIINKSEYSKVVQALNEGEVVSFPTETVMGLAVAAFDINAYNKLINVKSRPFNKAFPFVVGNINDINKYAYVNDKINKVISSFLPGPLTIVLKKKENIPSFVTAGQDTIAIRIPDNEVVLNVLKTFNKPILLTSANKSGQDAALNSNECYEIFKNEIEYIIEGSCILNIASTIVDMSSEEIKIIREGKIKLEDIRKVIGD